MTDEQIKLAGRARLPGLVALAERLSSEFGIAQLEWRDDVTNQERDYTLTIECKRPRPTVFGAVLRADTVEIASPGFRIEGYQPSNGRFTFQSDQIGSFLPRLETAIRTYLREPG